MVVEQFLAENPVAPGLVVHAITVRHVLAHTAGFADHTTGDRYTQAIMADPTRQWTRLEQVRACVEWFDPIDRPGAKFIYSDTGYVLLGGIVERLTGRGLGEAVRELLDYEKLGLQATWWEYLEELPAGAEPRAHQYLGEFDATDTHASYDLHGGGGIVSNARDMAHFMRALFTGRVFEQEATLATMRDSGTETYRLGLMASEFAGHPVYGHAAEKPDHPGPPLVGRQSCRVRGAQDLRGCSGNENPWGEPAPDQGLGPHDG
jgi:D-alanyl-D-alanine carboxypeptidase